MPLLWAGAARADVGQITFVRQFGIAYLPLLIMEADHLIERHAGALGMPGFTVNWTVLSSGAGPGLSPAGPAPLPFGSEPVYSASSGSPGPVTMPNDREG